MSRLTLATSVSLGTVGLNATQPVGWEPMDLDYVTWVLYYSWNSSEAVHDVAA